MHIRDIFAKHPTTFSFEFFPPKSARAWEDLYQTIADLEPLNPAFVSVTYGAGGSTRQMTHDLVVRIKNTTTITPIPHLTCVCHSEEEITAILDQYEAAGVKNVLALGGDPPKDLANYRKEDDSFQHASDLVGFLTNRGSLGIGVAGFPEGHPTTPNRLQEMDYLKAKVDAGADYIVTQLFFENRDFLDFRDRCELAGITVPILAGIMPVGSIHGLHRMADLAGGARFPARLLKALNRCNGDAEAVKNVGIHYAAEQCHDLLENDVRGIHFYTLNKSDSAIRIYQSLGMPTAAK